MRRNSRNKSRNENTARVSQKELISIATIIPGVLASRTITFATFTNVMNKYNGIYANGRLLSLRMRPVLQATSNIVLYGFTTGTTIPTSIGLVNDFESSNLITSRPWATFDVRYLNQQRYLLATDVLGSFNYLASVDINWEVEWTASFDSVDF